MVGAFALLVLASVSAASDLTSDSDWSFSRCPSECVCSLKESAVLEAPMRTVDCSSKGLRRFPSPGDVPADAQVLDLSGNRLRRLDADLRLWLPELELLDLADNRLSALPRLEQDSFGVFEGLSALRQLSLARNRLRRLGDDSFAGLLQLTALDLSGNRLDGISDGAFAGLSSLESLSLAGNRLSYAQKSWWRPMRALYDVDLSGNQLGLVQAENFAAARGLRKLRLSRNRLFRLSEHAFAGLRSLNTLRLDGNALEAFPAAALRLLRPSLKSLNLGRNPIYRLSTDDLANFPRLTDVRLDNMQRLRLVEAGAFKNLKALLVLELHDAPYLQYVDPAAFVNCAALSHLLLHNNNLTTLQPATLDSLPGLQELSFYGNPLACDCNARWLKRRLQDSAIVFQEASRLICASPALHAFKLFAKLPEEELPRHCAPRLLPLADAVSVRKLGQDIVLDCRAVGLPAPRLSWVGPDGSLVRPADYHPRRLLRNGNSLVLRHLRFEDAGLYTCIAESERGSAVASVRLNVTSVRVELVPLATGPHSASVAWKGADRQGHVFQLLYRPLSAAQHRYAASLSPAQRSFTLHRLAPDTDYELCLAFEDAAGVLTHISCAHLRTQPLSFEARLEESSGLLVGCGLGILALALLLLGTATLMVQRGHAKGKRFAYDNLAQAELGSPDLTPQHSPFRKVLPHLHQKRESSENVYSSLVDNAAVHL